MMKAIVIRQFGGPEVLEYADAPEPEVGAGEVLVRVAAASINPIDILERAGLASYHVQHSLSCRTGSGSGGAVLGCPNRPAHRPSGPESLVHRLAPVIDADGA